MNIDLLACLVISVTCKINIGDVSLLMEIIKKDTMDKIQIISRGRIYYMQYDDNRYKRLKIELISPKHLDIYNREEINTCA